jgi:hypothetical protein
MKMMPLNLYLVAPTGAEQLATVVIATDDNSALDRIKNYPIMKDYKDCKFTVLDLTEYFRKHDYKISVTKETGLGLYH